MPDVFPTWKHHRTKPSVIVQSAAEWAQMDHKEWAESPAVFADDPIEAPEEEPKPRRGRPPKVS